LLSTDAVQTYKPDSRAYQRAVDAFRLERDQIAFVAFGGWDAAGARTFGFPTFWTNRQKLPAEELGVTPDGSDMTLDGLPKFVGIGD
jgi:2-haloacid dehalogenase